MQVALFSGLKFEAAVEFFLVFLAEAETSLAFLAETSLAFPVEAGVRVSLVFPVSRHLLTSRHLDRRTSQPVRLQQSLVSRD